MGKALGVLVIFIVIISYGLAHGSLGLSSLKYEQLNKCLDQIIENGLQLQRYYACFLDEGPCVGEEDREMKGEENYVKKKLHLPKGLNTGQVPPFKLISKK